LFATLQRRTMKHMAGPTATNPFNSAPAGDFFAGRQKELASFRQWLSAINNQPQHACVVGRQGEGKTSFLQKAQSEAAAAGIIACRARLDAKRSAEDNLQTIIEKLLDEIDSAATLQLRKDWKSGKDSSFRVPKEPGIRSDDLVKDLQDLTKQVNGKACLICVDDGQAIHPAALSTLRNALQDVSRGYMLLMALRNDSLDLSNLKEGQRMIAEFATTSTDTGLPRLFGLNFLSLGPFDSAAEADDCIQTRLVSNAIKFAPSVVSGIGRVTGRYPQTMMVLANELYSLASTANPPLAIADDAILRQAFINTQRPLIDLATEFSEQETNTRKQVYRSALNQNGTFTTLQVARDLLGGHAGSLSETDFAADPVAVALERLVSAQFCTRSGNDQYQWTDPLRTHALRIVVT
jgi:hypothetical protein